MLFIKSYLVSILALTVFFVGAQDVDHSSLIIHQRSGEANLAEYFGPIDPRLNYTSSTGQPFYRDESLLQSFFDSKIQNNFFDLVGVWQDQVNPQSSCPNVVMNGNVSYIHYLYRLVGISYLQEALREYAIAAHQMGVVAPFCSLDWETSFALCSPRSAEMKKFIRRIKGRHTMGLDQARMVRLSKAQIAQQLNLFNQRWLNGEMRGIVESRLSNLLTPKTPITSEIFGNVINQACMQDKLVVKNLCSEVDHYYGFSDVGLFSYLLQKSNAVAVINEGGNAEGCLRRFSKMNSHREDKLSYLVPLSEALFEKIRSGSLRYKQGSLFIAGALKEFDDKGLDDFLYVEKEVKKVDVVEDKPIIVAMAPEPIVIQEPEPEQIIEPAPIVETTPEIVAEKISQFEQAVQRLDDHSDINAAPLDMIQFKTDFIFSPLMVQALKEPLQDFQTRQGLEDMAIGDKLGTTKEPVQLIFLKFLIDNNLHTGLFNVIGVLGERFYVRNDIDGKNRPVLIELKNDESTFFKWQITVVRPMNKVTIKK